ncbi:amino acid permease [Thermogymnomonas acidicola]|uniref:Amino acid permease n=1 Tax=Thermogymnomonas acidicola TaxID=399579 RepID=A0AA37F972_9ARCH|nr:APC family permease [Thermogymnomonas acidicola]GGM66641.1 amino acid permease [Thermogymnomonas acidicola]
MDGISEAQTLKRGAAGFYSLLGQSIAMIAPLGAVAATLTGAAQFARGSLPLAYIISIFGVLVWINTPYQFSSKINGAGGFYTFNARGVGPRYGLVIGYMMWFSYFMVITNSILFTSGVFIPGTIAYFLHINIGTYTWIPIMTAFIAILTVIAYLGIKPSLAYSFTASAIEIALLIVTSVVIIVELGPRNSVAPFTPAPAGGFAPVAVGMVLAIFSMSGSSAVVTLGEEAQQPRRNIRRALLISFLITGVVFVLTSYALTVGWGISKMSKFYQSSVPGLIVADRFLGLPFTVVLFAFIVNSLFAGSLAPLNTSSRMLFSMSRDGLGPSVFARVHPVHKTPYVSIITLAAVGYIVSLVTGLIMGPSNGFLYLISASSVALFIGHILSNVGLGITFRKAGEMSLAKHVILPAIATAILLVAMFYSLYPPVFPVDYSIITAVVFIAISTVAIAIYARNHQDRIRRAGLTDVLVQEQIYGEK